MKNIWKIISLENHDLLVSKFWEDDKFYLRYSICPEIGADASLLIGISDEQSLHSVWEAQTAETAKNIAKYILESIEGDGIFKDGFDEVALKMDGPIFTVHQ